MTRPNNKAIFCESGEGVRLSILLVVLLSLDVLVEALNVSNSF